MAERPITVDSFEKFLGEKKLMGTKCKKCGAVHCPPRPICLKCDSDELEWTEMSGKGKIAAFTVIGVGPMPMVWEGYSRENPYCSGVIELEEGPKISAQITGVDTAHPENIKIGTPLVVDFAERCTWHFIEELAKVKKFYPVFKVA